MIPGALGRRLYSQCTSQAWAKIPLLSLTLPEMPPAVGILGPMSAPLGHHDSVLFLYDSESTESECRGICIWEEERQFGSMWAWDPGIRGDDRMGGRKTSVTNFPSQKFASGQPAVENMTLGEAHGLD